jgi:hypothetical protein
MNARIPEGSIFEGRSPRGQQALAGLRIVFQHAGFYAEKERRTESSLRVYPERRARYPLLNPMFAAARASPLIDGKASVLCPVYSDYDQAIARLMRDLPAVRGCRFVPVQRRRRASSRYELHGYFVLPIQFVGESHRQQIAFEAFEQPLSELHLRLTAGLFLGSASVRSV